MKELSGGYWIWLLSEQKPDYEILGKYLFFDEDKKKLIEIARAKRQSQSEIPTDWKTL